MDERPHSLAALAAAVEHIRDELALIRAAVASLAGELPRLRGEVVRMRQEIAGLQAGEQNILPFPPAPPEEQLVTLDQMAAIVGRRKRALQHYVEALPSCRVEPRRGQPRLWAWGDVRSWLETTFNRRLPERYPGAG